MMLCNAEIIKKIRDLEDDKQEILSSEMRNCTVTYQTLQDRIKSDYNFSETRNGIQRINSEIRRLKHLLNVSNSTVIVDEFNMTIGECLVHMSQLNNEKSILERMSSKEPKERRTVYNGIVEYTEVEYDIDECKRRLNEVKETVRKLQLAIDRINLNNMIEI